MLSFLRAAGCLAMVAIACSAVRAQDVPPIVEDVVYGHKDGMALTFDVIKPAEPNGAGVLFIQSGGWYSVWVSPKLLVPAAQPLLSKGYTVFIVRHGSAPKFTVPEAVDDVRRAVRFIRMRGGDYDVDPNRLGVTGGSAGGHLTLMLATTGDDGDPQAKDEVLKQSSRIAAAVALYPPTDLRGWVTDPPAEIKKLPQLKPPLTFDATKEPAVSPLLHVSGRTAPSLMIHGDKDLLVPIKHSQDIIAALTKAEVPSKLVTIEGAAHGFNAKQNVTVAAELLAWFEKHLAKK